jgi:ring-1,2-phenylacetyl-CoA epoxidase subunit PaaC
MDHETREALIRLITPIADDEWIVGHRGSEWLGLAPELEEDLAFSSIHQDEMGHALYLYELLHDLGEPDPDELVYARPTARWRNACFVEAANGDWAMTVVRRYFYEVFDRLRLETLASVAYAPLTHGLKKIQREEAFHLKHFALWMEMLARGGDEARQRVIDALTTVWPTLSDLFNWGFRDDVQLPFGLSPAHTLKDAWEREVRSQFHDWQLPWPGEIPTMGHNGREGRHTPALDDILTTMRAVRAVAPESTW